MHNGNLFDEEAIEIEGGEASRESELVEDISPEDERGAWGRPGRDRRMGSFVERMINIAHGESSRQSSSSKLEWNKRSREERSPSSREKDRGERLQNGGSGERNKRSRQSRSREERRPSSRDEDRGGGGGKGAARAVGITLAKGGVLHLKTVAAAS